MSIAQQLSTIPLYIDYFLKVADQHSLQAPFIFKFYSRLLQGMKNNDGIGEIEAIRKAFLKDNYIIKGDDPGAGSRVAKLLRSKKIATIARYGISSKKECIFLSELVKIFQPETCVELGTSLGIATSYLAKASKHARIYTFEGNSDLVQKAKEVFRHLNCDNVQIIHGNIDETLPNHLESLVKIDMAIIDANHTYEALLRNFNLLKTKMNSEGIMVIDDIRWSVDMYRVWKKLISDETVSISIEFLNNGVLFFEKKLRKQHYILSY